VGVGWVDFFGVGNNCSRMNAGYFGEFILGIDEGWYLLKKGGDFRGLCGFNVGNNCSRITRIARIFVWVVSCVTWLSDF